MVRFGKPKEEEAAKVSRSVFEDISYIKAEAFDF